MISWTDGGCDQVEVRSELPLAAHGVDDMLRSSALFNKNALGDGRVVQTESFGPIPF